MSRFIEVVEEDEIDLDVVEGDDIDIDLADTEIVLMPDSRIKQTKTTIPNKEQQVIVADEGYELEKNIVEPIPSNFNDTSDATATANDIAVGKTAYTKDGLIEGTLVDRLQWKCDNMKKLQSEFSGYTGEFPEGFFDGLETSKVESYNATFNVCTGLTTFPDFDFSNAKNLQNTFTRCSALNVDVELNVPNCNSFYQTFMGSGIKSLKLISPLGSTYSAMCNECRGLVSIEIIGGGNGPATTLCRECGLLTTATFHNFKPTSINSAFQYCSNLVSIKTIDLINCTDNNLFVAQCSKLEELYLQNIKKNLQIGSGSIYGHLLTLESLLNAGKECHDLTGATSQTLTIGTVNKAKVADVYVKVIDITDEMRAEDEYIDLKHPFEVCESTDEGAMLFEEYMTSKNWGLA